MAQRTVSWFGHVTRGLRRRRGMDVLIMVIILMSLFPVIFILTDTRTNSNTVVLYIDNPNRQDRQSEEMLQASGPHARARQPVRPVKSPDGNIVGAKPKQNLTERSIYKGVEKGDHNKQWMPAGDDVYAKLSEQKDEHRTDQKSEKKTDQMSKQGTDQKGIQRSDQKDEQRRDQKSEKRTAQKDDQRIDKRSKQRTDQNEQRTDQNSKQKTDRKKRLHNKYKALPEANINVFSNKTQAQEKFIPRLHRKGKVRPSANHTRTLGFRKSFKKTLKKRKSNIDWAKNPIYILANQNATEVELTAPRFSRSHFYNMFIGANDTNWLFRKWHKRKEEQCNGKFIAYGNETAILKDVTLDQNFLRGRRGGENFKELLQQPEDVEFFKFNKGYLSQSCEAIPKYKFKGKNHLNQWMASFTLLNSGAAADITLNKPLLAVTRYEYVNIYLTMSDLYSAFLVMTFFNLTQAETNILFVDGHPWGSLDTVWATLFNSVHRAGRLPARTAVSRLIFGSMGYNSPLFIDFKEGIPLIEEFREFFLTSYDLPSSRSLNCSSLSVMFIWRRSYIAHPRNSNGTVQRKIKNEEELVTTVQKAYPGWKVTGVQPDLLDMRDQLALVSQTDIMIGMHGAGLALSIVLPRHGALVELMPTYTRPSRNHFRQIAKGRQLVFSRWINQNITLELKDYYTIVPPEELLKTLQHVHATLCRTRRNGYIDLSPVWPNSRKSNATRISHHRVKQKAMQNSTGPEAHLKQPFIEWKDYFA